MQDMGKHESPIEHIKFFEGLQKVVCCEQKKKVKVYNLVLFLSLIHTPLSRNIVPLDEMVHSV